MALSTKSNYLFRSAPSTKILGPPPLLGLLIELQPIFGWGTWNKLVDSLNQYQKNHLTSLKIGHTHQGKTQPLPLSQTAASFRLGRFCHKCTFIAWATVFHLHSTCHVTTPNQSSKLNKHGFKLLVGLCFCDKPIQNFRPCVSPLHCTTVDSKQT